MSSISENLYLLKNNKKKCQKIYFQKNKSPEDIIEFLIALHMVLEVGLNGLIREIIVNNLQRTIDKFEIIKNLDRINFIDKTTMFICMERYDFKGNIDKANSSHKIIGKLKDFSMTRNRLVHGAMIGSFSDDFHDEKISSSVELLNNKHLEIQVKKFKEIIEGMTFYLNFLMQNKIDKKSLISKFLNIDFLSKEN